MLFTPKTKIIEIDGVKVPIDPDFRIMCEFGSAQMRDNSDKLPAIAERFYFAGLPEGVDPKAAAAAILDFYCLGLVPKAKNKSNDPITKTPSACFDFEEDEAYFYAAFLAEYGVDLTAVKMHWLTFCQLFHGLPDDCKLKQIIGIRAAELTDIKYAAEKNRIRRLKNIYALSFEQKRRFSTLEERDRAVKAELKRRHDELGKEGDTS